MTITITAPLLADAIATEPVLINLPAIDRAKMVKVPTVAAANGSETVYTVVAGDNRYPTQIRVGDYPPSKAGATYNKSIKISTWVKRANSLTGEEIWSKKVITLAVADSSGQGIHSPAEDAQLLALAYTCFVPDGVAGVPDVTALTRSMYGVSDIIDLQD